ncbi:MAG: hypothetical protein JNK18_11850 [Cyclobacteriaceae bacterium]|nr:hypothetical protein [Cyclobacteriaceae bacterium]
MRAIKRIKVFLIGLIGCYSAWGQGGVDIKYIPIDSINSGFINREVKLDFTTSENVKERTWSYDTITLTFDSTPIEFVEIKGQGTDHYYFKDEFLQSENYKSGHILRIYKCVVKELHNDSIRFELTFQLYGKGKKDDYEKDGWRKNQNIRVFSKKGHARYFQQMESTTKEIWIPKKRLTGLLIRTW